MVRPSFLCRAAATLDCECTILSPEYIYVLSMLMLSMPRRCSTDRSCLRPYIIYTASEERNVSIRSIALSILNAATISGGANNRIGSSVRPSELGRSVRLMIPPLFLYRRGARCMLHGDHNQFQDRERESSRKSFLVTFISSVISCPETPTALMGRLKTEKSVR